MKQTAAVAIKKKKKNKVKVRNYQEYRKNMLVLFYKYFVNIYKSHLHLKYPKSSSS